jgi:hypothetical protein
VTGALYLDFVHPDVSHSFSQVSTGIARVEPPINSIDEDDDDSGDKLKSDDNNEVKVTKKKAKNATSKEHE